MKAMILAAGEGQRMRPLTNTTPKPMLPVGGRPLVERLIETLRAYDVTEIAINLHHLPHKVTSHIGNGSRFGVDVTYSFEEAALGTAGGAKRLEGFFGDEPFFVLYGDVFTDLDLSLLRWFHLQQRSALTMALHRPDTLRGCGVVELGPSRRVISFIEKPERDQGAVGWANAGVYVVEPDILRHIPPGQPFDFGSDLFPLLLERDVPVYGLASDALVLDIGTPEGYARAQSAASAAGITKAAA